MANTGKEPTAKQRAKEGDIAAVLDLIAKQERKIEALNLSRGVEKRRLERLCDRVETLSLRISRLRKRVADLEGRV